MDGFEILTREKVKRPWVCLFYGITGSGKTTLCWTAVAAGFTPMFVVTEAKDVAEWMSDYVYDNGGVFARVHKPADFAEVLAKFKTSGKFDMLILDGVTTAIQAYLSDALPKAANTMQVYGSNLNTNIRALLGLESLNVPVLMTALEKVDKPYEGGVDITASDDKEKVFTEKDKYMPNFPGQLEHMFGGIGCDLIGRMDAKGPTRTLRLVPSALYFSRIPTGYALKDIMKPTIHKLFAAVKGAPNPRLSYEETIMLIEQHTKEN